jgi:hypothetical protein
LHQKIDTPQVLNDVVCSALEGWHFMFDPTNIDRVIYLNEPGGSGVNVFNDTVGTLLYAVSVQQG